MNGAPLIWKSSVNSNAQAHSEMVGTTPVPSVGEAETYALSNGVSNFMYLSYIVSEMGLRGFPLPIPINTDSRTAEAFANGVVPRSRLRHIDVRQAWVAAVRDHKVIKVVHVPGDSNYADIFTKVQAKPMFLQCRDALSSFLSSSHYALQVWASATE